MKNYISFIEIYVYSYLELKTLIYFLRNNYSKKSIKLDQINKLLI